MVKSPNPQTGRRPGASQTQQDILRAAREVFAEESYERASLRRIAAHASVDPALLIHYFGSKNGVFAAAMALPFDPHKLGQAVFGPGIEGAGERLCRVFIELWESDEYGKQLRGVVRAAVSDASAATTLRSFLQARMLGLPATFLNIDRPEERMTLVGSHLVGMAFARYILGVEPLASMPKDALVHAIAPAIQHYLEGDLHLPGRGRGTP